MKHASIKTLVAVLLVAAGSAVEADDGQPPSSGSVSTQAQHARGNPSTSRDAQQATLSAGERRRSALKVYRVSDAGSLRSRTSQSSHGQRWKWSANQVPETHVMPL